MLVPINENYKSRMIDLFASVWGDPDYRFYFSSGYEYIPSEFTTHPPYDNCWCRQYLSVLREDPTQVIGCMGYNLNKTGEIASSLHIIRFKSGVDSAAVFSADLRTLIDDFFTKYHGDSIRFTAIPENHAATHYVRIIRNVGGLEIGKRLRSVKLYDGKFYDEVMYQVMSESYMEYRKKCVAGGKSIVEGT